MRHFIPRNYAMLLVMSNLLVLIATLVVCLGGAEVRAQSPGDALPRFEAASIKPMAPDTNEISCRTGTHIDASRFSMPCTTVKSMIVWAFDLKTIPIEGGPSWSDTLYRVDATADNAVGLDQLRLMLRTLLAERFQLQVHREAPMRPVFALVVAKGGVKMRSAESGAGQVSFSMAGKEHLLTGSNVPMERIIPWIRSMVPERPIVDETGLAGTYDFKLQWLPDHDQPTAAFLSALADLGLKLEDKKAPVEVLVIDHAEKPTPDQ